MPERFGAAVGYNFSFINNHNSVAGSFHFGQDVRAEDDGFFAADLFYQLPYFDNLVGVEAGGRLVEDEHFGVVDERLRQAHTLPVTLRKFSDFFVFLPLQATHVHHLTNLVFDACLFDALQPGYKIEIIQDGHLLIQRVAFGQVADAFFDLFGVFVNRKFAHTHVARSGVEVGGDGFHGGGFSGTVGSQKSQHFASVHTKRDVVDSPLCPEYFG